MGLTLIPREEKFFDLLEQAANNAKDTATVFKNMLNNWTADHPMIQKIRDLEHEGDAISHDIFDKLNRTFITPLDREDIHELASELDDVVDLINSVASRMHLYRLERIEKDLAAQADILEQAVMAVIKAVNSLRDVKNPRRVLEYCIEVDRLENEGDKILNHALSNLFLNQKDPIEIIKWKELFEVAETAIDKCEDVTNTIESIIVKHG